MRRKGKLLKERVIVFTGKFFVLLSINRLGNWRQVLCQKEPLDHLIQVAHRRSEFSQNRASY